MPAHTVVVGDNIQIEYGQFLDDQLDSGKYYEKMKTMIEDKGRRLEININDLRRKYPNRAASLLINTFEEIAALQKAIKDSVTNIDPAYGKEHEEFFVSFQGSFGNKHVTPRTLTSSFLGNLVCVEGIVTKCSLVKLKIVRGVHFCPNTGKFMERKYSDLTSSDGYVSKLVYLTKDTQDNPLETEFGLSQFKDHQTLTIQEMPEKAPAGQLPRSVDIICDNDLVDLCKPGDRIQVVGCYRCLPAKHGGFTSGIFRTAVIAYNINFLTNEAELRISREDMSRMKKLSRRKDIFELLSKSLAPSIHGHEYVKKAILCLLLGGSEKILPNGTRLRGDINVLLIGDPSVAKSQLLRYVLRTAPRAVPTTGRGSSGVGLTAAVTSDTETGERRLEAGAMVLADRGVVCIDEFDKMSDIDRTAIHEVMEQGKVTITKAGIHARLNARCSVLAAANPVYGRYDQYKTPMENIGLQDSLLSRFDLIFVLLDLIDTEDDERIADHVVRMHRYRNPKEQDGDVLPMESAADFLLTKNASDDEGDENHEDEGVFEKYDPLLHGRTRSARDKIINVSFMRKYILICKSLKPPALTEAACEMISEEYSRLRSQDSLSCDVARTQPITARTLETMIRLSTAHAKARFSRTVDEEDARTAIELVQYAIFRKVLDKKEKKKRQRDAEESDEETDEGIVNSESRSKRTRSSSSVTALDIVSSQDEPAPSLQQLREQSRVRRLREKQAETAISEEPMDTEATEISSSGSTLQADRLNLMKESLNTIFTQQHQDSLPLTEVVAALTDSSVGFSREEVDVGFSQLSNDNAIMIADDTVYRI